jgi:hypothetical protein
MEAPSQRQTLSQNPGVAPSTGAIALVSSPSRQQIHEGNGLAEKATILIGFSDVVHKGVPVMNS